MTQVHDTEQEPALLAGGWRAQGAVQRHVASSPEHVYDLLADVTRTGEWSPECTGGRWLDGASGPAPGARFAGRNRWGSNRWTRTCEVLTAERGRELAYRTVPDLRAPDSTVWRFTLEPSDGGTRVTESYEILQPLPPVRRAIAGRLMPHHRDMRPHLALTLERLAAVAEGRVPQLRLPGQAAAPEGPVDVSGMYVFHAALRRDLDLFLRAARATPAHDRDSWRALLARWDRFARVLHKHHAGEDAGLWPLLAERVEGGGDAAALATLQAMSAEHAAIDPLLAAARDGLAGAAGGQVRPDEAEAAVAAAGEHLQAHLAHEETEAMALVQRHLTPQDWEHLEETCFRAAYTPADVLWSAPWALRGLPREQRLAVLQGNRLMDAVVRRVLEPAFVRGERRAFRHVAA